MTTMAEEPEEPEDEGASEPSEQETNPGLEALREELKRPLDPAPDGEGQPASTGFVAGDPTTWRSGRRPLYDMPAGVRRALYPSYDPSRRISAMLDSLKIRSVVPTWQMPKYQWQPPVAPLLGSPTRLAALGALPTTSPFIDGAVRNSIIRTPSTSEVLRAAFMPKSATGFQSLNQAFLGSAFKPYDPTANVRKMLQALGQFDVPRMTGVNTVMAQARLAAGVGAFASVAAQVDSATAVTSLITALDTLRESIAALPPLPNAQEVAEALKQGRLADEVASPDDLPPIDLTDGALREPSEQQLQAVLHAEQAEQYLATPGGAQRRLLMALELDGLAQVDPRRLAAQVALRSVVVAVYLAFPEQAEHVLTALGLHEVARMIEDAGRRLR